MMSSRRLFISHRSIDKGIANLLAEFFSILGLPKEAIFCSSLPGNDVLRQISNEIKLALRESALNIVILSADYYKSAYCLNEAGVAWFSETPVIVVALPEVQESSMIGFLDSNNKLRRLDIMSDVLAIYDQASAVFELRNSMTATHAEGEKLVVKYNDFMSKRKENQTDASSAENEPTKRLPDDEQGCVDSFLDMWENTTLTLADKLFVAYIIEERITTLGDRWLAEHQIACIKQWEEKNQLGEVLSVKYGACLSLYITKHLVSPHSWTSHGNVREYKIYDGLRDWLWRNDFPFANELDEAKSAAQELYLDDLPF